MPPTTKVSIKKEKILHKNRIFIEKYIAFDESQFVPPKYSQLI